MSVGVREEVNIYIYRIWSYEIEDIVLERYGEWFVIEILGNINV